MFCFSSISRFAKYPDILRRALNGACILDLGCCFGQDLRLLAADGVPTNNMYASDLHSDMWTLGFELFGDEDRMHAQFIQADIFETSPGLDALEGKIDILIACQFLHLWDWDQQLVAMRRIARLSNIGTVVVGYQRGREKGGVFSKPWGSMFVHDPYTFEKIWQELGQETNKAWVVDVQLVELEEWGMKTEDKGWMDQPAKGLNFIVTRER